MKQQTAVEWLIEKLEGDDSKIARVIGLKEYNSITKQAKQMENEQLKNMYLKGIENYDPTFKRKSQWTEVDNMTKRLK